MFKYIIETLKEMLRPQSIYENLEAYIIAGNPQNSCDVDRLEKEFYRKQSSGLFSYTHFND